MHFDLPEESRRMTDHILIHDLFLRTIIGINEEERTERQDVVINLVVETDTRRAGQSDDIADAVNYRTLTKQISEVVENSQFLLVERLAEVIATLCLADSRVDKVKVTVEKPLALRFARSVGVSIERSREHG
jgi:dihydroneopterin aldolase/D-erythro-7,8-dihydroneopterin triphosphate epimerase